MSSLIAFWSEKLLGTISMSWNLLRHDLWPKLWSIMENECSMCTWRESVFFWILGWKVLKISINPNGLMFHWRCVFSYWFSVFHALSIGISNVILPTIRLNRLNIKATYYYCTILELHFLFVSICLMQGGASMLDA